jgi:hypothetical protein
VFILGGETSNASSVRVVDADVIVIVIFHDDGVSVEGALRDPFIGLRFGEATLR